MAPSDPDISQEINLGSYLRQVREAQGKSLDDAARVTRIGKNYLIAIEEGSYARLPNAAYVKGFLRIYAGYLGLSGDELVARFDETSSVKSGALPAADRENERTGTRETGRWWLLPLVLLALLIVTATIMKTSEKQSSQKSEETTKVAGPSPAPLQRPVSSATVPAPTPPVAVATNEPHPNVSEAGDKGIILKLKVNQDSTLNITIDDTISQFYDLKAGDLIEWKGSKSFTLDISNAGGIEGELNGRMIPPFGASGKPAHVVLSGTTP